MIKNKTPPFTSRRAQAGLTLVELLVAMVASLLILTAAGSVYLVARQGFQTNDDRTRTLESGRLALDILTRNIRMAGATNPDLTVEASSYELPAPLSPLVGTEGGAAPDSILIAYSSNTPFNAGRLSGADCLGQAVGLDIVMNQFSVSADGQLSCAGNGGAPGLRVVGAAQPLVAQVVDLQLTYSIARPTGGAVELPDRSKPDVLDPFIAVVDASAITAAEWLDGQVRAVHVCLDVASFEPNTNVGSSPGLNCRGAAFAADNRVHRIYRATVNVRNSTRGGNRFDPASGTPQ